MSCVIMNFDILIYEKLYKMKIRELIFITKEIKFNKKITLDYVKFNLLSIRILEKFICTTLVFRKNVWNC